MSSAANEIADLFNLLESNKQDDVNEVKSKFEKCFSSSKEPWLVSGLVDYYNATGSLRPVDILVKVSPPHDRFLFDKLDEGIRGPARINALELLGHVVRRNPLWLHKIAQHTLLRNLLRLLKEERDFVPLMCGLLPLVTLLPMIPAFVSSYFTDIFSIFSRLASWDNNRECNTAPGHKEHLQLGLYWLFHNLYNLYPNNFLDFLKREYSQKECLDIFNYTIKPMLETVKLHPLLVTTSKNAEASSGRFKKMEYQDILADCRRYSLEGSDKSRNMPTEDVRFRSRCGTDVSTLVAPSTSALETGKSSTSAPNLTEAQTHMKTTITTSQIDPSSVAFLSMHALEPSADRWISLSEASGAGSALSAPHTPLPVLQDPPASRTPIAEIPTSLQSHDSGSPPEAAIEATPENTPIKDVRQLFNFPNNSPAVRALGSNLSYPARSQPPSPLKKEPSPFRHDTRVNRVMYERNLSSEASPQRSPLKKSWRDAAGGALAASVPNSPVPLGALPPAGSPDWPLAKPQPQRDGYPIDTANVFSNADSLNREDKEVIELSKRGEVMRGAYPSRDGESDYAHEEGAEWEEDEQTCEEKEARCAEGKHGLHMPHSTSMFDFARRVTRIRFYSQCILEPLSSSYTKSHYMGRIEASHIRNIKIKKSSSWPDLKVGDVPSFVDTKRDSIPVSTRVRPKNEITLKSAETQTVDVWAFPHEHYLFSDILENFEKPFQNRNQPYDNTEIVDKPVVYSPYDHLDKYINILTNNLKRNDRDEIGHLREQLRLLQLELHYECHRREVHAQRNRRLLGKSRKNWGAEEQNVALKNQVTTLQIEIENLKKQLQKQAMNAQKLELEYQKEAQYSQRQVQTLQSELQAERAAKDGLAVEMLEVRRIASEEFTVEQNLHAALFDLSQKLNRVNKKSELGDKLQEHVRLMQRELLLSAEREIRLGQYLNSTLPPNDAFAERINRQCKEELQKQQESVNVLKSNVEFLQHQKVCLENLLAGKENSVQEHKKQLGLVRDEYGERLKAVENKYQSVIRINQRLESHCLELLQRVSHSPHTASRDLTAGFSPQSSPLSGSLASSEGPGPPLASCAEEPPLRSLQMMLNRPERPGDETNSNCGFAPLDDDRP